MSTPPLEEAPLVAPALAPLVVVPLPEPDIEPLVLAPETDVPLEAPLVGWTIVPLVIIPAPEADPVAFPLPLPPPAPLTELPVLDPAAAIVPDLLCGALVGLVLEQATIDRTASGTSLEAFISSSR
jgi:hypothetical protein